MKINRISFGLIYESPRAEAMAFASEGVMCGSGTAEFSAETGASWTDETDASLVW